MRAVLTYHSIDESGSPISVSRATFRRHVDWLASGAVPVVTVEELMTGSTAGDAVAITFDDGFESVASIAAPLLRERHLPATVFVVTGHAGLNNDWGGRAARGIPTLPLMDWRSIAGLVDGGGFTLGAHSRTHCDLTAADENTLREEIFESVDTIESRAGARPSSFAYPYGRVNACVANAAASACRYAFTTELRPIDADDSAHRLPRLDAYYFQSPGRLESWGRPQWHAYLKGRAMLRAVRGMVAQ